MKIILITKSILRPIVRVYRRTRAVLRNMVESWPKSAIIKQKSPTSNRLRAYFSLLYWETLYGFDFTNYCSFRFWEKTDKQRKSYISCGRNARLIFRFASLNAYIVFLDKGEFNRCFSKYIHRGWLLASKATDQEIIDFISEYSTVGVIAKPLKDYGGHGVIKFDSVTDIGDTGFSISFLRDNNYILEERIINSDHIQRLAPGSLNTIRIVTLVDNIGKLHVIAALLRMGDGKAITDNFFSGGMACPIDIATSKLTRKAYGMNCAEYEFHPYTGIKFEGYDIPEFKQCIDLINDIVKVEPEARFVGWDLAITPNGIELLEGNIPPGENIMQMATGRGLWYEVKSMQ